MMCSTGRTFALFPGHTRKPSIRHQWLPRTWSWDRFGLDHGGQCKLPRDRPSVPPLGDGGTNFAVTRLIRISSVRIFWHVPNAILTSSATSLIVRRLSARMISRTRATVSSVWEVEGLPGRGSSSKDRCPVLKWEYHSNVFDRLRQDSPKAAWSISYISAPVFPRRKQKSVHTRCYTFSSIVKCDAHCCRRSPKGLHRANVGKYRPPVLHIHLYRVATCPTLLLFRYVL